MNNTGNPKYVNNPEILLQCYAGWLNEVPQNVLVHKLPISLKTISRYVGMFKGLPEDKVALDRLGFHYHLMDEYGIPWDKYEEVLRLMDEYSVQKDMELTPRMAKWAWRLQQRSNPILTGAEVYKFMMRYVHEEQRALMGVGHRSNLERVSRNLQTLLSERMKKPSEGKYYRSKRRGRCPKK